MATRPNNEHNHDRPGLSTIGQDRHCLPKKQKLSYIATLIISNSAKVNCNWRFTSILVPYKATQLIVHPCQVVIYVQSRKLTTLMLPLRPRSKIDDPTDPHALAELGHPQPGPTPMLTDKSTASGIANENVKQQRSKAMDMCFNWIRDGVRQNQLYCALATRNYQSCRLLQPTKHHSTKHHRMTLVSSLPR